MHSQNFDIAVFSFSFCSFCSSCFLISLVVSSLTHRLFKRIVLYFQIFGVFLNITISLIYNLISVLSENIFYIIATISKFLKLVLTWSVLVNVPQALEKNVNFAIVYCFMAQHITADRLQGSSYYPYLLMFMPFVLSSF